MWLRLRSKMVAELKSEPTPLESNYLTDFWLARLMAVLTSGSIVYYYSHLSTRRETTLIMVSL